MILQIIKALMEIITLSNNFDFQESKKFKVKLIDDDGKQINTRDILLVSGKIQMQLPI